MKSVFKRLKGSMSLEKICYNSEIDTACISMKDFTVSVNPYFVQNLMDEGLSEEEVYNGVLNHEIGHYKFHPFNIKTSLLEINALKENNIPFRVKNYYDDFVDNCNLILHGKDEGLSSVYKTMKNNKGVLNILCLYYAKFSDGDDYGCVFSKNSMDREKQNSQLKILDSVNVNTRDNHGNQIIKFYKIFKDEFDSMPKSCSLESLMKDLNDSYGKEVVGKEVKKLVDKKLIDEDSGKKLMSEGGINVGDYFANSAFEKHKRLADEYTISVEKLKKYSGYDVPFSPVNLSIDSIGTFDPFNSFASGGKPFPPIAKSWDFKGESFVTGEDVNLNDLLILMDSSGSMKSPETSGVSHAIISGIALAKYYIMHDSKVGVVNFSSDSIVSDFCKDYELVCKSLFYYQGDGTNLDIGVFKGMICKSDACDVVLISDEMISNYDSVINTFKGLESDNNLLYIFSINNNSQSDNVDGNIHRINIDNPEDIRDIVLKKNKRGRI